MLTAPAVRTTASCRTSNMTARIPAAQRTGSTIRPFTSGKIKSGVKDQIIVSKDSATKQTQEEEKKDKTDDSPISDDDFNEILEMLNMGKNRNQAQAKEQNNTNGFPKRY